MFFFFDWYVQVRNSGLLFGCCCMLFYHIDILPWYTYKSISMKPFGSLMLYIYIYIIYCTYLPRWMITNDHEWSWKMILETRMNIVIYIYIHIFICLFRKIDRIIWWAQARPGYLGIEDWPWWNGASVGHIFCPLQPSATKQATERHRKKMDGFKHLGCWCFILLRLMIRLDW